MIIKSAGHRNPHEAKYLFVDGSYFHRAMQRIAKEFFECDEIPVDYKELSTGFQKTFYYDCLPPKGPDESTEAYEKRTRPVVEFFDQLRLLNGFHVYEGTTSGSEGRARQKKVDIMIAVDMLTHAFRGNMNRATLLTGDLDFKPLVDALVQNGMYVTLWYDPASTNKELVYAADARRLLDMRAAYSLATEDFQLRFKMPSATTKGKSVDGWQLIKSGKTSSSETVELFRKENRYSIIYPDVRRPGFFIHLEHDDLELLEKWARNLYIDFYWE